MPKILNMKDKKDGEIWIFGVVRIDRATPWGNPFIIGIDGNRDEVCDKYWVWLHEYMLNGKEITHRIGRMEYSNKWVVGHLKELKDKDVACWCAPERCHGNFLVGLANGEIV